MMKPRKDSVDKFWEKRPQDYEIFYWTRFAKKIGSLKSEKTDVIRTLKNNIAEDEFLNIAHNIKQKIEKLAKEIKSRHAQKYERDNIKIIESACRNRRFR